MFKRMIAAIIILAVILCPKLYAEAARNVSNDNRRENESVYKVDTPSVKGDNWLIYWYVCGSNIESTRIAWDRAASDFENGKVVVKDDQAPGDITR